MKNLNIPFLQEDLITQNSNVIVAVSGGADSVALLYSLLQLASQRDFSVMACHVNHNLRGAESDADCEFVRTLCETLNVRLFVRSIDVAGAKLPHESTEQCARRLRYAFFDELAAQYNAKIATAHNANDNAETVLLNICRGTGLKGLCGIPQARGNIIRPLLATSRNSIEMYCSQNNLRFVTDKTNLCEDYSRNKIRLSVIPKLQEINPSLINTVSRMTGLLSRENVYIEQIAAQHKENARTLCGYNCLYLQKLDSVVVERIIISIISDAKIEPSAQKIADIAQIIWQKKGKINLVKNKFAVVSNGLLNIENHYQNYRKINTKFFGKNHENN